MVGTETLTFEKVWAALMENREQMAETRQAIKETDRQVKETSQAIKETDRQMVETRQVIRETSQAIKETDRQVKDFNRRFGDFTNRFGEVVEYMISPNLQERFRELGLDFPQANRNSSISDHDNNIFLEMDVKLENGDKVMLVEIKTKLTTENVKEHIERLEKMRTYANLHGDKRSFLGAAAGVVMTPNVKEFALKQGLFVVEPSGESLNITSPDGKPKEW